MGLSTDIASSLWTTAVQSPVHVAAAAALLLLAVLAVAQLPGRRKVPVAAAKEQPRTPGVWVPSDFKTPVPPPYPDWDVATTKPLPYRPFKHNYHVTMGIRNMDWHEWIELDNEFPKFHAEKTRRLAERGDKLSRTGADAFDAAMELLEEFRQYLPARYPSMFRRTAVGIDNVVTGESFDYTALRPGDDPMAVAAKLVQDDLAIMMEGPDGQYYLRAACIVLAGFWRLSDKFGMPLSEIHTSGDVPQFKEKLQGSMERFFVRMKPEKAVTRNNYFLQIDDGLGWSDAIGPEDSPEVGWDTADVASSLEHMHFRSERQSLRRLPKSGGVVFTIRTYFVPVVEMAKEPYVPGRLADGMKAWAADVSSYKGKRKYVDVTLPFLEAEHRKQVEQGLIDPANEPSRYPF
ncbi:uncharacterized protein V1510DRAFT_109464 [Dipodascopsis tothii]|uniref:uncharacterized protein n=1 Tax=Dipodascopsis tothii TaxID=44089 RepID=UPI0034CD205F